MNIRSGNRGFTVIELLVVIVLVLVLGTVVVIAASGVRSKDRNADRQNAINTIQGELETYYAQTNKYPTLANLKDAAWRAANLKELKDEHLQDPRWDKTLSACTVNDKAAPAETPMANCYSYQVTASDGSACDNTKADCAHYTLTATLEGGEKYVKSSLN